MDQQSLHERPNAVMNSMIGTSNSGDDAERIDSSNDGSLPASGKEIT